MTKNPRSFLDTAMTAIETAQKPLTAAEIVHWAQRTGKLITDGRTPINTMHAAISRSIDRDRYTPFIRKDGGRFSLRFGVGPKR